MFTFIQNTTSGRSFTPVHCWDFSKLDKMMLFESGGFLRIATNSNLRILSAATWKTTKMHGRRGVTCGPWKLVSGCKSQMLPPLANCFDLCRGLSCLEQTGEPTDFIGRMYHWSLVGTKGCTKKYFWTVNSLRKFPRFVIGLLTWWILTCNPTVISQLALHCRMKWLWLSAASLPQEGLSIVFLRYLIFHMNICSSGGKVIWG